MITFKEIFLTFVISAIASVLSYAFVFQTDIVMAVKTQSIVDTLNTYILGKNEEEKIKAVTVLNKIELQPEKLKDYIEGKANFTQQQIQILVSSYPEHSRTWFSVSINKSHRWLFTIYTFLLTFFVAEAFFWVRKAKTPQNIIEEVKLDEIIKDKVLISLEKLSDKGKEIIEDIYTKTNNAKTLIESTARQYIETTLKDFIDNEKLYNGIRASHITVLDEKRIKILKDFMTGAPGGECGITFTIKGALGEYAKWAFYLDESLLKSIYSTNIIPACELFSEKRKTEVIRHLEKINKSSIKKEAKIRLQILNTVTEFHKTQRDLKLYFQYYINDEITFKWTTLDKIKNIYLGDYIIYDEKIVLRYFEDEEVLEIITGKVVEKYLEPFIESRMPIYDSVDNFPYKVV